MNKSVIMTVAFLLLSPGILLSVVPNSKGTCESQVPLPFGILNSTCKGETYDVVQADCGGDSSCEADFHTSLDPICKQQEKCRSLFASGYTSAITTLIHALLFMVIAYYVFRYDATRYKIVASMGILFVLLSPGLLLNVTPESRGNCESLVPLPSESMLAGASGSCDFDTGTYTPVVGGPEFADCAYTEGYDACVAQYHAALDPVCAQQKKCQNVFMSTYTGKSVWTHTVVFFVLYKLATM